MDLCSETARNFGSKTFQFPNSTGEFTATNNKYVYVRVRWLSPPVCPVRTCSFLVYNTPNATRKCRYVLDRLMGSTNVGRKILYPCPIPFFSFGRNCIITSWSASPHPFRIVYLFLSLLQSSTKPCIARNAARRCVSIARWKTSALLRLTCSHVCPFLSLSRFLSALHSMSYHSYPPLL
jgi:hypothetical protein